MAAFGRDPDIQGGRWVFRDPASGTLTRLPVGTIASSLRAGGGGREFVRSSWPYLTEAQIEFALNFDFPAQGEPVFDLVDGYVIFTCACGEPIEDDDPDGGIYLCRACRRAWAVRITVTDASEQQS